MTVESAFSLTLHLSILSQFIFLMDEGMYPLGVIKFSSILLKF
jgi:hypothetical protein